MLRLVLALILFAALGGAARAERRVALVIGNAAYTDVPALRNSRNDAEDVARALAQLGFDVTSGLDLDGAAFTRAVAAFSRKLDGADVALFYYSGHGVQVNDQNYLIPVDAHVEDEFGLKREGVALADILGEMEGRAKLNLVFLDACRDNPLAERLRRQALAANRSGAIGRGLARIDVAAQDMLLVYATGPGKVASDGTGRNSPFTTALLQHVAEPGVEIESLMKRVTAGVRLATGGMQEPERLSRLSAEFYFAKAEPAAPAMAPAVPAPAAAEEAAKAFEAAKAIGTVAAFDAFLKSFPTGVYADLARVMKADLAKAPAARVGAVESVPPQATQPAKPALAVPDAAPVIRRPPVKRPPRLVQERPVRLQPAPPRHRVQQAPRSGGTNCFRFNGALTCN